MGTIRNHRTLKKFIIRQKLECNKDDVFSDLKRTSAFFGGTDLSKLAKQENYVNVDLIFYELFAKYPHLAGIQKAVYLEFVKHYLNQHALYHRGVKLLGEQLDEYGYSLRHQATNYKVTIDLKNNGLY